MKMHFQFFALLFLWLVPGLHAQRGNIEGFVVDSEGHTPMEYAQIGLYQLPDSAFVDGTITDPEGTYRLEKVRNGEYYLEITYIGYRTRQLGPLHISSDSPHFIAEPISLEVNISNLEEVSVVHQLDQTEREIDRQVYYADQFKTATGGNAVDILQNIPSVIIGPDGEVSLRGTGGFLVYLNGKPTQMDASVMLSQIAANSIEKIEVITIPTAQYDAQGKGGIINITTHSSALDGTYLSTGLMIGGDPGMRKLILSVTVGTSHLHIRRIGSSYMAAWIIAAEM